MWAPCALALSALVVASRAALVTWVADAGLERAQNYVELLAPCGNSRLLLPASAAVLRLPPRARELVLPRDAELRLPDAGLVLGPDRSDSACVARDLHYRAGDAVWSDPSAWSSRAHSAATPDAERVPCAGDVAAFPADAGGAVVLPDETREVAEVRVGAEGVSEEELAERARTGRGFPRFSFGASGRSGLRVSGSRCRSSAGCPCQRGGPAARCPDSCPAPACSQPVTPEGNCCAVCGAVLRFVRLPGFALLGFRRLVARAVAEGAVVEYHVGVLDPDEVQLVVVERGTYSGAAALVVDRVRRWLAPGWARAVRWHAAGVGVGGAGWAAAGGALLAVLGVGGVLWARYYPPRCPSASWRRGRSDSLLTLTRRDSAPAAAFRNPLYDSRRGSVRITQHQ